MEQLIGYFAGRLVVEYIDGHIWRLVQFISPDTFGFSLSDGTWISPDDGMITDFASWPRFLRGLFPNAGDGPHEEYGKPAVIHDYLYQTGKINGLPIERRFADAILFAANIANGVDYWLAKAMDDGLLIGGQSVWDNYRRKDDAKK